MNANEFAFNKFAMKRPSSLASASTSSSPLTPTQFNLSSIVVDPDLFKKYLKNLVNVLLNDNDETKLADLDKAINDNMDLIRKFLCDFNINVLFIKKLLSSKSLFGF